MMFLLFAAVLQTTPVIPTNPVELDNEYVRVARDAALCASAKVAVCEDRVIVAISDLELRFGSSRRKMARGDVAVFKKGQSYEPPTGRFFEVTIKPNHPPFKAAPETIPPVKNVILYDEGGDFFVREERLDPGETRPRHSHNQRVVFTINERARTSDAAAPRVPAGATQASPSGRRLLEPTIHSTRNDGDMPQRNVVIEFRPERRTTGQQNQ